MFVRFYASIGYLHWAFYSQESRLHQIFFPRNTGCLIQELQGNTILETLYVFTISLIHLLAINFLYQMESKDCALFCHQIEVSRQKGERQMHFNDKKGYYHLIITFFPTCSQTQTRLKLQRIFGILLYSFMVSILERLFLLTQN